tara:strand:+ start:188 stop:433 length:246 start_codon:yes stop_codon:yes gene_type:complete
MRNQEKITVYGTMWCPDCSRSKRLLDSKGLEYVWIDIEQNPDSAQIVRHLNKGLQVVPTIILPGGKVLAEPSNWELEDALA